MTHKEFAISIAREAGDIIKRDFKTGVAREWKSDDTPVIETDMVINKLLIDAVDRRFPGHRVLGEEMDNLSDNPDTVWVCDPLDGTMAYSHGIPTAVFSLALVQTGEPVLGVIYDALMDRMFVGVKGSGATLNDEPIHVSDRTGLQNALIGIDGWRRNAPHDFEPLWRQLREEGAHMVYLGSIAYMAALVATGQVAATLFSGNKSHDTAAARVIIEEAGGKVTSLFGQQQRYDGDINGNLASNGHLHETLLKMVHKTLK